MFIAPLNGQGQKEQSNDKGRHLLAAAFRELPVGLATAQGDQEIYGSRAMGNRRPGLNIDLALTGGELGLSLLDNIENSQLLEPICRVGKSFIPKCFTRWCGSLNPGYLLHYLFVRY